MAPRANWKGFLRLSLVTCPVALYPCTSTATDRRRRRQVDAPHFSQQFWPCAQVGPAGLKLGKRLREALLGLARIAGLKAYLLLALADDLTQIVRNSFSELIDSSFGMLPWTRHSQRHCTTLLYH
ncbi:hypothetical protein CWO91_40050 [Bradyrhizobium genosp. SA-3]|nr:hypothetical protein CWO91_40050 [Bradyrhizobium genosp. SA-3]